MASGVTYTFSANTKIKSAEVNQNFTDAYPVPPTSFTPVWSSLGAGFVQGSSTVSSLYTQSGKNVLWHGAATINTGGGWNPGAAGEYHWTLPVPCNTAHYYQGSGYILDSGSNYITSFVSNIPAATFMNLIYNGQTGQGYGAGNPIVWATGDIIQWTISYIAA